MFFILEETENKLHGKVIFEFSYPKSDIKDVINLILELETELFRSRIKLERSINQ